MSNSHNNISLLPSARSANEDTLPSNAQTAAKDPSINYAINITNIKIKIDQPSNNSKHQQPSKYFNVSNALKNKHDVSSVE
jgi:hypothetical protein